MAPLIEDTNFCHDDDMDVVFDRKPTTTVPLHESETRKTVSFGGIVAVHEVMSRYDYTSDEAEASWFDPDEMRRMKDLSRSEARLLDWGHFNTHNGEETTRGLESRTRDGIRQKRRNRMDAYGAVFCEIEFQHQEGFVDDNAIADAYYMASQQSLVSAQLLAEHDELDASFIYDEK